MPGGGRLTIATRAVPAEADWPAAALSRVCISVRDTGVGMDADTRARIFEPFFTTKDHGKGTGLGLSTVYGIVAQTGGTIRVESEVGRGSTFSITLSAAAQVPHEARPEPRLAAVVAGPTSETAPIAVARQAAVDFTDRSSPAVGARYRPTILLAEDEPAVRSLVEHVLVAAGFAVVAAVDGREALDIAATLGSIDLLLTDVMMPRLNGPSLAVALRERRPDQRVLFMSGFTDDVLGEHGIVGRNVQLLPKPFSPKELVARVRLALAEPTDAGGAESEVA
jgi:two-component system cell cycle sensor histidine kinase/response regulator CckA